MTTAIVRTRLVLLACPQCDGVAEVVWRDARRSRDPATELVKIQCVHRHWFLMPAGQLDLVDDAA